MKMRRAMKAGLKYRWYVPAVLIAMLAILAFHKPQQVQNRIAEIQNKERQIQHAQENGERKHQPAKMGWEPALEPDTQ
jgi:hypothetical protein